MIPSMMRLRCLTPFCRRLSAFFVFFVLAACSRADVTLPALLADHMVVQRGLPVHIWGMSAPAESVSASFRNETRTAIADELGRWSLYFSPGEAGGPFPMTIQGNNTLTLSDILVGDVWVASGQSNMELPMTRVTNAEAEIAAANDPKIRLFQVKKKASDHPLTDVEAKTWVACTPETVADSSAVAYFFARDLRQKESVPIGLIESYWGGTAAEAWTSLRALSADASLMPVFAERVPAVEEQTNTMLRLANEDRDFEHAAAEAKAAGQPAPNRRWHPDFGSWDPSGLYNGMIAPLTPFAIRGVIWYQGESNAGPERAPLYARLFQTMIRDWWRSWGEGDFPFLFVQLPNWIADPRNQWPEVREAQRQTLVLRNTGMAVTIDVGDPANLHPPDKQDVAARLALIARAQVYGEKIEYSGPLFRQVTTEDHALRLWFEHATNGLVAKGGELKGFEVAGSDGKFSPAEARIEGPTVVVSSSAVESPVYVRYGWLASPDCNLYNRDGLPASPFRAEINEPVERN
jgi:sialate O-acetylesterase